MRTALPDGSPILGLTLCKEDSDLVSPHVQSPGCCKLGGWPALHAFACWGSRTDDLAERLRACSARADLLPACMLVAERRKSFLRWLCM